MIDKISKTEKNHTIAANDVFHTARVTVSNDYIAHLSCLCNEIENLNGKKKQNFLERMIDYIKKKFNHIVLRHNSSNNEIMIVCQNKSKK